MQAVTLQHWRHPTHFAHTTQQRRGAAWRRGLPRMPAAAAGPPQQPQQRQQPQEPVNLSGLWAKLPERSDTDGFEAALDVLGLQGLQRVTARLIDGLDIDHSASTFRIDYLTIVPLFRVTEAVSLAGGSSRLGRRDLRWGAASGRGSVQPDGVLVELSWGPPMPGSITERYTLLEDGCLAVTAVTRVGQQAASCTTVYARASGGRDALLAQSKQRNPSVAAVLQGQRERGLRV